jgi:hypothetical protein
MGEQGADAGAGGPAVGPTWVGAASAVPPATLEGGILELAAALGGAHAPGPTAQHAPLLAAPNHAPLSAAPGESEQGGSLAPSAAPGVAGGTGHAGTEVAGGGGLGVACPFGFGTGAFRALVEELASEESPLGSTPLQVSF